MSPRPIAILLLFAAALLSNDARAQAAAGFYAGKRVDLVIGVGSGSGYDAWGRAVARHLGRHLPGNPVIVPRNMPGGGSLVAANHIYTLAPKDGTVVGLIARDAVLAAISGAPGARFDPTRLSWIGSPTIETTICIASSNAAVKTIQDVFRTPLILGNTGAGTGGYIYPKALNAFLGTKFELVSGFPSTADIILAIERKEVDGVCETLASVTDKHPEWIPRKEVNVLLQGGAAPDPALPGVPFALDLAPDEATRQALAFLFAGQGLGRPFIAPPDMPRERVDMLRRAFAETMRDPEFLADAKKAKLHIEPIAGEQLEARVKSVYATPQTIVDRVRRAMQ